ncbi:hypothetical protein E3_1930 [Rhodococcus phage E3]|uniref:hypothetical protein n=1 Tax=Rhodococcus phage E3 TaxID=1007869 RepID=UPI0002C6BBA0|nr:hypothetical protein M176_gp205 [Rhodococcus phage E3]AEQ21113.1 hypothetical protein E3_1930 [Rhodococcus phage E3]
MIVDIDQETIDANWAYKAIADEFPDACPPERIAPGVYLGWGIELEIKALIKTDCPFSPWFDYRNRDRWPYERGSEEGMRALAEAFREEGRPSDYGVCDGWEQVIQTWPRVLSDPRPLIIGIAPVHRKHQSERQGWRWEKHGKYIGNQRSFADYLYDEPEIDVVYTFSIYEVAIP